MSRTSIPVAVVLDRVRSLYNVGAFFRTCDAAGVSRLHLAGYTGRPPDPRISKTALGAEESVPWSHHATAGEAVDQLRAEGFQIAAIETTDDAIDIHEWRPKFPICAVFGNEVDGVPPEISEAADVRVKIPMLGLKESLNVAVAGGVVLFELLRKYRAAHESTKCGSD